MPNSPNNHSLRARAEARLREQAGLDVQLSPEETRQMIQALGIYIDKHFGAIGGFSTRHSSNEFVTVLPYSDLAEAEEILKVFITDFQEQGIRDIHIKDRRLGDSRECIEIPILVGFAQGQPIADLETVIKSAKSGQKEIGRLLCSTKE